MKEKNRFKNIEICLEKGDSGIESALIETLLHLNLLVIEIKNIIA